MPCAGVWYRFYVQEYFGPGPVCVDFWFHMYGEHMGSLALYVEDQRFGDRFYNYTESGDQGDRWLHARKDIFLTSEPLVVSVSVPTLQTAIVPVTCT